MKILGSITASLFTLSAQTSFAQFRDLPVNETVKLDVQLYLGMDEKDTLQTYYQVQHDYTNTVVCELDIDIPIKKADGSASSVSKILQEKPIFPAAASIDQLVYKVEPGYLPAGAKLDLPDLKTLHGKATCSGWGPNRRLPRQMCSFINPDHDKDCKIGLASGNNSYFLTRNQAYLGICACP